MISTSYGETTLMTCVDVSAVEILLVNYFFCRLPTFYTSIMRATISSLILGSNTFFSFCLLSELDCSGEKYDYSKFRGTIVEFGFPDHK